MKAILVIDVPRDCWDCHLVDEWGYCNAIKITSNKYEMSVKQYNNGGRPSWCPLKPMPTYDWHEEGKENECEEWYRNGWNACLEEINK